MYSKKNAIALLVTVVFVILIFIAINLGIKNLYDAKQLNEKRKLFFQTEIIVDDILNYLKNSSELSNIAKSKDPSLLYSFISSMHMFSIDIPGYTVVVNIKSARDKININSLKKGKKGFDQKKVELFRRYFREKGIEDSLLLMIMDSMNGYRVDGNYLSDLFDNEKELFRDYIASNRHLEKILILYEKKYHDDIFAKLEYDQIFRYDPDRLSRIDLNYLTPQAWQFISGCSKEQAVSLHKNGGLYKTIADVALPIGMLNQLKVFNISFFEPYIRVEIMIKNKDAHGTVSFEYDIATKKASRFVYKI